MKRVNKIANIVINISLTKEMNWKTNIMNWTFRMESAKKGDSVKLNTEILIRISKVSVKTSRAVRKPNSEWRSNKNWNTNSNWKGWNRWTESCWMTISSCKFSWTISQNRRNCFLGRLNIQVLKKHQLNSQRKRIKDNQWVKTDKIKGTKSI